MRVATSEVSAVFGDRLTELPYPQSLTGPPWLTGELVAGDGRYKLARWLKTAPPTPWENLTADSLLLELHAYGDVDPSLRLVLELLSALPRCVADYVAATTTFIASGRTTLGWCGGVPDFDGRPWLIVISGHESDEVVSATIAHEIAHVWSLPPRGGVRNAAWSAAMNLCRDPSFRASHAATVARFEAAHSVTPETHARESTDHRRREDLAERLARSWGYRKPLEYLKSEGTDDANNEAQD